MSQYIAEVPDVIVKPGRMPGQWSPRAKAAAFLLCVLLYVYLLLLLKTVYLKNNRLDHIAVIAAETEDMIHNLQSLDQTLVTELDSLHGDY